MQYRNFKIIYPPAAEARAQSVLQILKTRLPRIEEFYREDMSHIISIHLPATRQEFTRLAGPGIPNWSAAVFIPRYYAIVIKKAQWVSGDVPMGRELLHEISHAYFYEKLKDRQVPLWFNEGLAEFLSGQTVGIRDGVTLSNALLARKIIPLAHIDSLLSFQQRKARLAYLQSLTVVSYLHNQFLRNDESWRKFMDRINAVDFDRALQELTQMDNIDFEIRWYRWLQHRYRWFVLFNLENLIWVAMIVVLVGALYAIRYRNRKVLSQWELEEQYEAPLEYDSDTFHFNNQENEES